VGGQGCGAGGGRGGPAGSAGGTALRAAGQRARACTSPQRTQRAKPPAQPAAGPGGMVLTLGEVGATTWVPSGGRVSGCLGLVLRPRSAEGSTAGSPNPGLPD
jgi:hypothetical protein